MIFNTDSTFYFIGMKRHKKTLQKQTLKYLEDYYQPFIIKSLDHKRISISLSKFRYFKDRTILHDHYNNKLIQNLDSLIKNIE